MTDDVSLHRTADRDQWLEEIRNRWNDEAPTADGTTTWVVNQYRDADRPVLPEEVTRALFLLKVLPAQIGTIPEEIEELLKTLLLRRDDASRIIAGTLAEMVLIGGEG